MAMTFLNSFFVFFVFSSPGRKFQDVKFSNGTLLKVEIARTKKEKTQGLMGRTHLPENQGMLFIFERPQKLSFWTKGTYIPLSLGYFDKNYVLKEIHFMEPQNLMEKNPKINTYKSSCHCQYAMEVNRGWFSKNKIKIGDQFLIKSGL